MRVDGPILAIDSSTDWAGVAVLVGNELIEENWAVGREGTRQILPVVDRLLKSAQVTVSDLVGCGVAIGPGSFSGLRVGISLAKGLHLATGVPLVALSTFVSTLERVPTGRTGIGVIQAGRTRLVWAESVSPDQFESGTFAELIAAVSKQWVDLVVGEVTDDQATELRTLNVDVPASPERLRRAGTMAFATRDLVSLGRVSNPEEIEPVYLEPISSAR